MASSTLTISDRLNIIKRQITDTIKSTMVNDVAPGFKLIKGGDIPTITDLKTFMERHTLASLLPYEAYDSETGLWYNQDTVGFMLYANPATGISPSELAVINGFFNQAHKSDTVIQVSIISDPNVDPILERWKNNKVHSTDPSVEELFKLLAQNRVDYLKSGKWNSLFSDEAFLTRNLHLVISYTIPIPKGMSPVDISDDDADYLIRTREAARGSFRTAKIFSESLNPAIFINILNGILNPSTEVQPELHYDENNLISSQIIDNDTVAIFDSGASTFIHKDKMYSMLPYHIRQFPQRWPGYKNGNLIGSFTNNILRIPCPFIITLTVVTPDQVTAKGMVKRKTARATQMSTSPLAKYATQWNDRKVDWDYTSKKVDDGNRLMNSFYQIILFTPQGKEQECEQALKSVYGSLGWVLTKSRYMPVHALLGALPMGVSQDTKKGLEIFGHFGTRLSWTCTNIAPWLGEWKGTGTPMMMFNGRRGQITFFDPFDNNKGNYNIACYAASGAGKSFFTQEWVFSCLGGGGRTFIFDAGHSYKNICRLLNGTYLEFGIPGQTLCFNPFSDISDEDPEYFEDQLPLLKKLLSQMASPDNPLSSKQKAVLEKAVVATWDKYKSNSTITLLAEILHDDTSADGPMYHTGKDLAMMFYSYTKNGMYGRYFEGKANVNLDNHFVVLDLDALNSMQDLQGVILMILMMRITQVMYLSGNKKQRKLCIIDEAWRLLRRGSAGEFIEEGYRVARKHGGSFMTITQSIGDYYKTDAAQAAYVNSDFEVALRMKPDALAKAVEDGHIDNSSGKVDLLRSLDTQQGKYSEAAISSPDGLAVVRFIVDPITEKIYSTKAEEVEFIRKAEARGVNIFDAVTELISRSANRN